MSDISTENYLAHFGVKGMRWGVRKSKTAVKTYKSKSSEQKASIKKKAAIAATVGVGAVAVGVALKRHNKKTVVALPSWSATDRNGQKIFGDHSQIAKVYVRDLPKLKVDPFDMSIRRFAP